MKFITKLFIASFLICGTAFGQASPIRNDTPTALRDLGADLNVGRNFAVDQYGQTKIGSITPGTGATNLGKAEDAAHTTGDVGVMSLAIRNAAGSALAGTEGDYSSFSVNQFGSVIAGPSLTNMGSADITAGILKAEDSAAASGDALVGVAGVIQTTLATPAAAGDYAALAMGSNGQALVTGLYDVLNTSTDQIASREDNPLTSDGTAGLKVLYQTQDPLTVDQGTNGDASFPKVDRAGRTITTLAPAGESFQACSAAATNTADTAIKAAVASNRIYVTNISCSNNSAVPSQLSIKDGATVIAVGSVSALAVQGAWTTTFPVPLRGTANTALNFAMTTTSTSTICCASGYISVN
jgi:hypothetical protein